MVQMAADGTQHWSLPFFVYLNFCRVLLRWTQQFSKIIATMVYCPVAGHLDLRQRQPRE